MYNDVPKLLIICSQNVNSLFNTRGRLYGRIIMSKGTEQNKERTKRKENIIKGTYNRPDESLRIETKRPFDRRRKCQILYVLS